MLPMAIQRVQPASPTRLTWSRQMILSYRATHLMALGKVYGVLCPRAASATRRIAASFYCLFDTCFFLPDPISHSKESPKASFLIS